MVFIMDLITYGLGKELKLEKIEPIKNEFVKPKGGLWASPINSSFGWREWCESEGFRLRSFDTSFQFSISGNILVIDSEDDLKFFNWDRPYSHVDMLIPDFEDLVFTGYDAVHLTVKGEYETRFSVPYSLYGWDCESVLIMNLNCIKSA
jgi:hypothetical protein